jgi:uncharacterized membrane protein YjdF
MVINKILSYAFLLLGIFFFLFPYRFKTFYFLMFVTFGFAILFSIVVKKFGLTEKHFTLILIMLWLNVLGELWFYFNYVHYDKILHFCIPFLMSWIFYDYLQKSKQNVTIFFPFTILGMLAFFEIIEWFIDSVIGFPMLGVFDSSGAVVMSKLTDTMVDLCMGILGTLTFLAFRRKLI